MSIEAILLIAALGVAGFLIVNNVLTPHARPSAGRQWFEVLDVPRDATIDEIDAAHAALRRDYDRPLPADLRAQAEARLAEIDRAYHQARGRNGDDA